MSCKTGPILDQDYKGTLLGEFMDGCIDDIRQLASDLGARPYRVFWVRTRWSGRERGEGVESVISEEEVTPTPKVEMGGLQRTLLDIGTDEQGAVTVTEISPRYTEHQLTGDLPNGRAIPSNETFSWEISLSRGDSDAKIRRRYMIQGVPVYEATRLQWTVRLIRSGSDREANGTPG